MQSQSGRAWCVSIAEHLTRKTQDASLHLAPIQPRSGYNVASYQALAPRASTFPVVIRAPSIHFQNRGPRFAGCNGAFQS